MTLAIVAPAFNQVSETFIADHVRTLAPGRTVLVCQESLGAEIYGCPVLSHVQSKFSGFGRMDTYFNFALLRLRRRFGPALSAEDRIRLTAFFREQGVDRVLAEFGYSGAMIADLCAQLNIPLYVYFRGNDASASLVFRSSRRRYRRLFQQARAIFCVSQYIAERIIAYGCPREKIHINPSGAVVEDFPPGTPEPGRIVAVGRLVEKKAPDLTLEAFGKIAAQFPEAHLDMVGDGPLEARCREVIARLGIADRVTMHGSMSHRAVATLMGRASMFVQHSVTAPNGDIEGFPTIIAEAMSSALPVVSTRHSGIPEHVLDGQTGLVVEERDVEGMAAAMARILADPAFGRALGAAARIHAVTHLNRKCARRCVREVMGLPALALDAPAEQARLAVQPILQPQKVV